MINDTVKNKNLIQILVVDDSPASLKLLTDILTNQGYQVRSALDGALALRSAAFEEPDIILLDIKMPGMDGYEVCRQLKSDDKIRNIPVIFISALEEIVDKVKGFAVGGVDYITKPFEPGDVVARVGTHLRLRSLQKQLEERNMQLQQEIDDHKHTKESLKGSEAIYKSVVENIGIGISLISPNMEILSLNNQMRRWFPDVDIVHKPVCYKAFNNPPRGGICSYCPTHKTLQDGRIHESVTETPVGEEVRNYRIISSPVKNRDGNIIAAIEMVEDTTEKKKAQEALKDSENKYRTIFETTGAATVIIEEDTTISLVNTEFEKLSGYSKGEVEGKKRWTEFVVKDDLGMMLEYQRLRMADPGAALRSYEFRIHDRAGNLRDIFMTVAVIPGTRTRVASLSDITERKRMGEELKKERETFFTVLKNYPHGVVLVDRNGVIQYVNPEFTEITGYTIEDIPTGRDWFQKAYPFSEYRHQVIDAWKVDRVKIGIGMDRHFSITRKDGTSRDIEFRTTFLEHGSITVLNDITIRKRAEEALRESEQILSDIIDFLPDATFAIDLDGKVLAWNRAIEKMTGVKAADMLGKGDYEYAIPFYGKRGPILIDLIFVPTEEIKKKYHFVRKEGNVLLAEADVPVKKTPRSLWAKAGPLYDSRGNMVGAIESIRDITKRKRVEAALKKRETELKGKSHSLAEINTTLKVLLKQRERDKDDLEENILSNVKSLIIPYIEKLKKSHVKAKRADYVSILESNLNKIISPFANKLSSKYLNFTPTEIRIAGLIKEGKTSKEIAEILNSSTGTVEFHRENIRSKLNIRNKKTNLRSYLLTFS